MKIYQPKGRAREYAALALNPFKGCTHDCYYCYVKSMFGANNNQSEVIGYTDDSFRELARQVQKAKFESVIMISFMTDLFCDIKLKDQVNKLLDFLIIESGLKISVLTKGNPLNFIQNFERYNGNIKIGFTLTIAEKNVTLENAITSLERINIAAKLKKLGVATWASFEPIHSYADVMTLINKSIELECFDYIKVGKMNGKFDVGYDWTEILCNLLPYLRNSYYADKFYIKNDLSKYATCDFVANERNADYFNELI